MTDPQQQVQQLGPGCAPFLVGLFFVFTVHNLRGKQFGFFLFSFPASIQKQKTPSQ
jgi:hypothetical protein